MGRAVLESTPLVGHVHTTTHYLDVVGVRIAIHEVGIQAVGNAGQHLQFETLNFRTTRVDHRAGKALGCRGEVLHGDLHIVVVGVEHVGIQAHAVVEQLALDTQFERLGGLGIVTVDGFRHYRGVAAHIEATALEAGAVAGVDHGLFAHLVIHTHLR